MLTRVLLQSAGFLYLTELGEAGAGATFNLTADRDRDRAGVSAHVRDRPTTRCWGTPPSGMLATPAGREAGGAAPAATAAGRARLVRVVQEWLGIDDVARTRKGAERVPGIRRRQPRRWRPRAGLHQRGA